jgi:hypothetical protein
MRQHAVNCYRTRTRRRSRAAKHIPVTAITNHAARRRDRPTSGRFRPEAERSDPMSNTELWLLAPMVGLLLVRLVWLWHGGRLVQPADWTVDERFYGRVAAAGMAIAALAAGVTAAYVATRVPWVGDFTGLLGRPPIVHGRPTLSEPTGTYLFGTPLRMALAAIALTDPVALRILRFRGSRDLVLRALPLMALALAAYSIAVSIGALTAAVTPAN